MENKNNEKDYSLWEIVEQASKEVAEWPEWKRQYSANPNLRDHSSETDQKEPVQSAEKNRS